MKHYEKTYNLYARHKNKPNIGKYNVEKLYAPEFGLVGSMAWRYTDKIDGTNIRLTVRRRADDELEFTIAGRKDNSNISGDLKANLLELLHQQRTKIDCTFGADLTETSGVTLYGEGYGPGIQKHGGQYRDDKGFILFDIAKWHATFDTDTQRPSIDQYYLPFDGVQALAGHMGIDVVPEVFQGLGFPAVVKKVREGFKSVGGRDSEGIVASAPGLFYYQDGGMRRMKFKLKTKDFVG